MNQETILRVSKGLKEPLPREVKASLINENLRNSIYPEISIKEAGLYHILLKALFEEETKYRNDDSVKQSNDSDLFENIYHCAFLLYCIADVEDILAMWKAKQSNFDLGCGFDGQFLIGAGIEKTLNFLSKINTENSQSAYNYIQKHYDMGDFDNIDEWFNYRKDYFQVPSE